MSKNKNKESVQSEPPPPPMVSPGEDPTVLVDVLKLSIRTKNRIKLNGHNPHNIKGPGPAHRCADTLHGWTEYTHHYAGPMMLTEDDYLAALKASCKYQTHEPAVSPHRK